MLESKFKANLRKKLSEIFPGCILLSIDPNDIQGMPDLLMLYENKWAALETKRSKTASRRPNQSYYVDMLNDMSFAAFIFPENEEVILDDLQRTLRSRRPTRVSKR